MLCSCPQISIIMYLQFFRVAIDIFPMGGISHVIGGLLLAPDGVQVVLHPLHQRLVEAEAVVVVLGDQWLQDKPDDRGRRSAQAEPNADRLIISSQNIKSA